MYYISSYREYDDQDPDEFWKWGSILAERFLNESGIVFGGEETMLEIGCGIGRMTQYFAKRFKKVSGLDVSPAMITQARENLEALPNVEFYTGNGHDLGNFESGSFDFVFSYIVFQHIPDPTITLQYVEDSGRVLKPGGYFYFQVNNMPEGVKDRLKIRSNAKAFLKKLKGGTDASQKTGTGPSDLDNPAWRGSRVTLDQVEAACQRGALRIERLSGENTQYLWVKAIKESGPA